MKKSIRIALPLLFLLTVSCIREDLPTRFRVPEGTPVTLTIEFGAEAPIDVQVGTKAEVARADESRVHDLYVLIFDNSGTRRYGRYFSYQHKWDTPNELYSDENESEGWYVENKTLDGVSPAVAQTVGAVKIATAALNPCTLVLLANVSNTLISLGGEDPLDALNSVTNYTDLKDLPVRLEQDIVVRNDLFLMLGEYPGLDMTSMTWGERENIGTEQDPVYRPHYSGTYKVTLSPVDAKVKFRIRANSTNIKDLTPHKWAVYNIPSSCYLYTESTGHNDPGDDRAAYAFPDGNDHYYFDTDPIYFDAEETDANGTWQTFTFYMLESCLVPSQANGGSTIPNAGQAASYYLREKQDKTSTPLVYTDNEGEHTLNYVTNGDGDRDKQWTYAPERAPFVTFTVSMTFENETADGIDGLATQTYPWDSGDHPRPVGVTGEMTYTVHLGDFSHTGDDPLAQNYATPDANDYNTRRGHFYTYDIVINNASNLYAEVRSFEADHAEVEGQPGQEGSLLLNSGGVVNCDAHYEYRSIEFAYNSSLASQLASNADYHFFSWYVKTPFSPKGGEPEWKDHRYQVDSAEVDFLWVKFAINKLVSGGSDPKTSDYSTHRIPYPGKDEYKYDWYPGYDMNENGDVDDDVPLLMDINQLINYIYYQYKRKALYEQNHSNPVDIFDQHDHIRATAFVDEYYYEHDPFTGMVDVNLWRKFVNADPREMHILSDVQPSRDQKSNLINSSHSIIQRSIQTIYNIDSPDLNSIWGTEHKDEIRETLPDGEHAWTGWPWGISDDPSINIYVSSEDNGRLNSAALWGIYPSADGNHDEWEDFLEYAVDNSIPELKDANHRKMAYSCLTRNRDNNGDGVIDPQEIRWYMASINQLKGMWVGNESLSTTARVYQPWKGDWRAHVLSSTCPSSAATPKVLNAEEGVATFNYALKHDWAGNNAAEERLRESVRCVRNVGTYTVGSVVYDITNAPYARIPDQYYTMEENVDPEHPTDHNYSTYTIQFRRLDPRSLREYTDKELPFHDEKSSNNRVYLELHTQSRASRATETPDYLDISNNSPYFNIFPGETQQVDMGTINETITNDGYNKYCPTGYRLPNQTELAIMTLVLPSTYWNGPTRLPTRTYFSHGLYAPANQQKDGEESKLGFAYGNSNIFLPDRKSGVNSQLSNRIRCVRDSDMSGTISGKMYLANTRLMEGQTTTLTFNFSSTAASFESDASLFLCYTDESGNPAETRLTLETQPSGLHFRESQTFTAPELVELDPPISGLPAPMQLKLVLSNVRENSEQTFYAPFTLVGLNIFCDFEILPGKESGGFPINVMAETTSQDATISSLTLYGKVGAGAWTALQSFPGAVGRTDFETVYYFNPVLAVTTYGFKLVAESEDQQHLHQSHTSTRKSMEIIRFNYTPNAAGAETSDGFKPWTDSWWQTFSNANGWHTALVDHVAPEYDDKEQKSVINTPWEGQKVENIDFSRGDFIEADMDLYNCVFIQTVSGDLNKLPMKNQVIGLDNIFSLGKNSIAWLNGASDELHFYYPAHVGAGNDQLQIDPVYLGAYNKLQFGQIATSNGTRPLVLYFDQNGVKSNGTAISSVDSYYTSVVADLIASHSLYIGAQEGSHLTRATYRYVRVVRNDMSTVSDEVTGGFSGDINNGGNL